MPSDSGNRKFNRHGLDHSPMEKLQVALVILVVRLDPRSRCAGTIRGGHRSEKYMVDSGIEHVF